MWTNVYSKVINAGEAKLFFTIKSSTEPTISLNNAILKAQNTFITITEYCKTVDTLATLTVTNLQLIQNTLKFLTLVSDQLKGKKISYRLVNVHCL